MQKEQGFTILQIAHRLDTLRNSDYLFYLSRGQVVETGGGKLNEDGTWDFFCEKGAAGAIDDLLTRKVHCIVFTFSKHNPHDERMAID